MPLGRRGNDEQRNAVPGSPAGTIKPIRPNALRGLRWRGYPEHDVEAGGQFTRSLAVR
jgi:hypothetical protein